MKETKPKFLDKLEENQLAQEIDNSIEEIDNNNPVITEEDNNPVNKTDMIIDPNPTIGEDNVLDIPIEEIPTRKPTTNKVRIMDGNFPF